MKHGSSVAQRFDFEIGDRAPADVGDAHPKRQRVNEVPDDDVLLEMGLRLRVVLVRVQRMVVHRDHAEEVVVVLGDRLARPVLVDVADLEVLEVPAERAVVGGHQRRNLEAGGSWQRPGAVGRR